eukprot:m.193399 g.193399  ORF g.193399 m.193399 type:complete len:256 (+) comp18634_c0_seq2:340-1107(+)
MDKFTIPSAIFAVIGIVAFGRAVAEDVVGSGNPHTPCSTASQTCSAPEIQASSAGVMTIASQDVIFSSPQEGNFTIRNLQQEVASLKRQLSTLVSDLESAQNYSQLLYELITATDSPTQQPTSLPTRLGYVVMCGNQVHSGDNCSSTGIFGSPYEYYRVECCSDTAISAWRKAGASCPWVERDLAPLVCIPSGTNQNSNFCEENCNMAATYAQAVSFCGTANARLCTQQELLGSCGGSTGCQHDHGNVWTSTLWA